MTEQLPEVVQKSAYGVFGLRFPDCVIRRPSACTLVSHGQGNFMVGPPLLNVRSKTDMKGKCFARAGNRTCDSRPKAQCVTPHTYSKQTLLTLAYAVSIRIQIQQQYRPGSELLIKNPNL